MMRSVSHSRSRPRRRSHAWLVPTVALAVCFMCYLLLSMAVNVWPTGKPASPKGLLSTGADVESPTMRDCAERLVLKDGTGFEESTLESLGDSIVLMLFTGGLVNASPPSPPHSIYQEQRSFSNRNTTYGGGACGNYASVHRRFADVSGAYLSSPFPKDKSDYHTFAKMREASFWTIETDNVTGRRTAHPLVIDVVYTHVDDSSPSHEAALRRRGLLQNRSLGHRFRDWDELRYALRSFYWHALAARKADAVGIATPSNAVTERHRAFLNTMGLQTPEGANLGLNFRHIFIVVAQRDQVPQWLNEMASPRLRIVTHDEIFSAAEASSALPTLSSYAIESALHRIKGISRFFWYFNNDMMVGRTVSPFDLFRPLSPPRQALRFAALTGESLDAWSRCQDPSAEGSTHALFLEPILHAHGHTSGRELADTRPFAAFEPHPRDTVLPACFFAEATRCEELQKDKVIAAQCIVSGLASRLTDSAGRPKALRSNAFFAAFEPPSDPRDFSNNVAGRVAMERLQGILPTSTYSHAPLLVDRRVYAFAMDGAGAESFAAEVTKMRRAFVRAPNDFSPVHQYTPFVLSLRRARDIQLWMRHRPLSHPKGSDPTEYPKRFGSASEAVNVALLCPLCGDSYSIQQQHSDLFQHLSGWAGMEGDTGFLTHPLMTPGSQQVRTFPTPISAVLNGCGKTCDNVIALYADVFHHLADRTVRFIMVQDAVRVGISLALVKRFYAAGTPALFTAINDDLDDRTAQVMSGKAHRSSLQDLLAAAGSYAPPAPWEK